MLLPPKVLVLFGVFPQVIGVGFGCVEITLGIGRYPFGRDHGFVPGPRNWNEAFNDSVFGTADSDALLEARVRLLVGLGVDDVERVVSVNENAARAAKLFPLSQKLPPGRKSECGCSCGRRRRPVPWNPERWHEGRRTRREPILSCPRL